MTDKSRRRRMCRRTDSLSLKLFGLLVLSSSIVWTTYGFILPQKVTSTTSQLSLLSSEDGHHHQNQHQRRQRHVTEISTVLSSSTASAPATNNNGTTMIRDSASHDNGRHRSTLSSSSSSSSSKHRNDRYSTSKEKKNKSHSNHNHNQKQQKPQQKLDFYEKEFQWLNWVYCQWKKYEPGTIPLSVLKQMEPAIATWGRRSTSAKAMKHAVDVGVGNASGIASPGNPSSITYNAERAEEL